MDLKLQKDSQGYGYEYTSLDWLLPRVQGELKKEGLEVRQALKVLVVGEQPHQALTTEIVKVADGSVVASSEVLIPHYKLQGMSEYQSIGAGITYMRRYSIVTLLGLTCGDDIDASNQPTQPQPTQAPQGKRKEPSPIDERLKRATAKLSEEAKQKLRDRLKNGEPKEAILAELDAEIF